MTSRELVVKRSLVLIGVLVLCSHGKIRRKRAEEGDPVEMVSTTFTNAKGQEQTVTGMYVRKKIHDMLVETLQSHEKSQRMLFKAKGMQVVDAQLQATAGAGPSNAAAWQAADIMKGALLSPDCLGFSVCIPHQHAPETELMMS